MNKKIVKIVEKYNKNLQPKIVGDFAEEPIFEPVPELKNVDKVLAFSSPETYGASNAPLAKLVNRDAYLLHTIENLAATQEEVNNRIIDNKYVSPATLPALSGVLLGSFQMYSRPAKTLTGSGWYVCDGSLFLIASAVGQVLNNFLEEEKLAWNLETVGDKIRIHDLLTTPMQNNGGYFLRPMAEGTQGTKSTDFLQAHQHGRSGIENWGRARYGDNAFACQNVTTFGYVADTAFPNAGEPRIGNETTPCHVAVLPIIYLGV